MKPIQNRELKSQTTGDGKVRITWSTVDGDPPEATFFLEHMVGGTWRFPTDVEQIDTTTFELTVPSDEPQQYRIISPDGTPSETLVIDASQSA